MSGKSQTIGDSAFCRPSQILSIGSLRYGDYVLRTTAGRAFSFVCSTGLSGANIERKIALPTTDYERRGGEGNNTQRFSCFHYSSQKCKSVLHVILSLKQ